MIQSSKRFLILSLLLATLLGCGKEYDDSNLVNKVNDLESRLIRLEELCKQMNTNIASLQTIVTVLQGRDYITNVIPVVKDGKTIGYTVAFAHNTPITIYHGENGKDGEDGVTPVVGVKKDTDGIYYWTLNGVWLVDSNGLKIKAEGKDGQDGADGDTGAAGTQGITPQLKIEDGFWYVSIDNGLSWTQLGKATGDKGEQGDKGDPGNSIFKSVEDLDDRVVFTLQDGSTIVIPKGTVPVLDITLSASEFIAAEDKIYEIIYSIAGADATTRIEVVAQDYYRASVVATDYQSGRIVVYTPSGDLRASRVLVFVSKGSNTIMRVLKFTF